MNKLYHPILLISIVLIFCSIERNTSILEPTEVKYYEDKIISCTLNISSVENNILSGQLVIKNKSNSKIKFKLNGFAFKCGSEFAKIPKSIENKHRKIPNYENLTESEKQIERNKRREERSLNVFNQMMWHSEILIESNNSIDRKIKLEFESDVKSSDLNFSFEGVYKKFIKP